MDRRGFLKTGAALGAGAFGLEALAQSGKKPNFIVFYADDLGYGDLSCYGAEDIQTPHIDRLAASGTRFTQWYSNSPVCSPSRVALLTGCYPQNVGVHGNLGSRGGDHGLSPEYKILPQYLKDQGYATGLTGKWHIGGSGKMLPNARGFDEFFGHLSGCIDNYSHMFIWNIQVPFHDLWRNETEVWENGEFFPNLIVREAKDFLRRHQEQPFFLYVPFNIPHYPMHAPEEYFDRFDHLPFERRYQAVMTSALDDCVGEIMAELDRLGLRDDTCVFFQSDNGPSMEARNFMSQENKEKPLYEGGSTGGFRGHKFSLYEGGIRLPAIMSWPGHVPAGAVVDQPGITMDILPTFVELAGGQAPDGIDGRDAWSVICGESNAIERDLFWQQGKQSAVRRGDWKLTLNGQDQRVKNPPEAFLADLGKDPYEQTNLIEENPDLAVELKQAIKDWEAGFPPRG